MSKDFLSYGPEQMASHYLVDADVKNKSDELDRHADTAAVPYQCFNALDMPHKNDHIFTVRKNERYKELNLYNKKLENCKYNIEEQKDLKIYLMQRASVSKPIDDKKQLKKLMIAQNSIAKVKKVLSGGRGNVIDDLERTQFRSLAQVTEVRFLREKLFEFYNSDSNDKKSLPEYLPDECINFLISNKIEFIKNNRRSFHINLSLMSEVVPALFLKAGNCSEYSTLSTLFQAEKLERNEIVDIIMTQYPMSHVWSEEGGVLIDAWAEGPAILKEDAAPILKNGDIISGKVDAYNAKKILLSAKKIVDELNKYPEIKDEIERKIQKNQYILQEDVKFELWNYKEDKDVCQAMQVLSHEFIDEAEEAPAISMFYRKKLVSESTKNISAEVAPSLKEVSMVFDEEDIRLATLMSSIREAGVNRRFGLNVKDSTAKFNLDISGEIENI